MIQSTDKNDPLLCMRSFSKRTTKVYMRMKKPHVENTSTHRERKQFHRFLNHFSLHMLHPCPKGTLSLVYWQLCIALSTLH